MSKSCEISACLTIDLQPARCLEVDLVPRRFLDICLPGDELTLFSCDLRFIGYQEIGACTLAVDSVAYDGSNFTVTASGGSGLVYSVYTVAGVLVADWQTSNVIDMTGQPAGHYVVQVIDQFGCSAFDVAEIVHDVDFQSSSDLTITSGTTVASTIPADVLPGDFMVLHLMHRDVLTPPAGWTLIETSATVHAINQRQSALYRVAQAGDESTNVTSTQATSQRFCSHIQVFRSTGTISIVDNETAVDASAGLDLPEIPSTAINQMAVVSMSNVFTVTSAAQEITAPVGYTQTTLPVGIVDKRLACAYKKLVHPETISGRFELTTAGSDDTNRTAGSIILAAS